MKTLIIYKSITRNKNTEMVAKAMAEVTGATLAQPEEVDIASLAGYDLIGFGSDIYGHKQQVTPITAIAEDLTET